MKLQPAMPHSKEIEDAVFEAALGFDDPQARRAFLDHWFRDDPAGLKRINDLLMASVESTSFFLEAREVRMHIARDVVEEITREENHLEQAEPASPVDRIDSWVGPYRLISRIGEGGGGVVYEAEQATPLHRRVALKIIRLGMDTESVIARFELERQALAMMDHRNIASVFDAGVTSDGRPYFAMELVKGDRITTHCDDKNLDLRGRLALFIEVCQAIQHAHQKGVIHRDIKPSNILVQSFAEVATPKVIDFGISKATARLSAGSTVFTGHDQLLGTPAYMSPEQVDLRGIDIDTRSDVYSLGVLLYELLAGMPPFDGESLANEGISQMRRILLEHEPPPPSRALSAADGKQAGIAAQRSMEPERLIAFLRGDLDAIIMKAMEKDRNRRYQTVNGLEMDVKRFLANEPVEACKPGRLYSLGKFVRRNRGACISGAAVAVSLVLGLGASTWLYVRESRALAVQERLLREAKAFQAEKAILRRQTEDRAIISRAAVLVSEGRLGAADVFLQSNPLENIEPTREAAEVFRAVGHWSGQQQQWRQALMYFRKLDQASRYASSTATVEGTDLLAITPLILEQEGVTAYNRFRSQALLNHLPVQSARGAQQLLKVSLLTPAEPTVLDALKDVANVCESGNPGIGGLTSYPDWDAFSMALYNHRIGDFEAVLKWREKCLSEHVSDVCAAAVRCLGANAWYQRGDAERAKEDLELARAAIATAPSPSDSHWSWWDWIVTRILFREVESAMNARRSEAN